MELFKALCWIPLVHVVAWVVLLVADITKSASEEKPKEDLLHDYADMSIFDLFKTKAKTD